MLFGSFAGLLAAAEAKKVSISDIVLEDQSQDMRMPRELLVREMDERFGVMLIAAQEGSSASEGRNHLCPGVAHQFKSAAESGRTIGGGIMDSLVLNALSVAEHNSCMGRIVASPTAGSCGILPSVLITALRQSGKPREAVVKSLFTAAGAGMVIANRACLAGAQGGCQAECGSASAMSAAALTELFGGTPQMCVNACAIALKSVLGLVCDPVAGLVEVPCIKRNVSGAVTAWTSADMALAGIQSVIPADEVVDAMKAVGNMMSAQLKETAEGGLAATPTGRKLAAELSGGAKRP